MKRDAGKAAKTAFDAKRGTIFLLDPEDIFIIEEPSHPLYDPRVEQPLTEAFVLSIMRQGVIEPVVIRRNGERAEVIDGRQRVRGAVEANKRIRKEGGVPITVPVVQWRGDDANAFSTAIVLNEMRTDDSLIAKARKANVLLERVKDEEKVAGVFGVTIATINAWIKLLDLHPKVQTAVELGRVSAANAVQKLGTLTREEQVKALDELQIAGGATSSKVREVVQKRGGNAGTKPLPGKKLLRRIVDVDRDGDKVLHKREIALLSYITGDISEARLGEAIPGIVPLLHRAEKVKAKAVKEQRERERETASA